MTFEELLKKSPKTKEEAMLLQAIAALSVEPRYSNKTPDEIFDHLEATCQQWDERLDDAPSCCPQSSATAYRP